MQYMLTHQAVSAVSAAPLDLLAQLVQLLAVFLAGGLLLCQLGAGSIAVACQPGKSGDDRHALCRLQAAPISAACICSTKLRHMGMDELLWVACTCAGPAYTSH